MKRILIALMLALSVGLSVGGCSRILDALSYVSNTSVSPTAVYVAANTFDALEVSATNYLRLKKCSAASGPVCRDPIATAIIIPAVKSGRTARNELEAFYARNASGSLGPQGAYDALTTAVDTLKAVFAQYNIKTGVAP